MSKSCVIVITIAVFLGFLQYARADGLIHRFGGGSHYWTLVDEFLGFLQYARADGLSHRFGGGIHYWTVVDDVDLEEVDKDGVGWFVSYQLRPESLLGFELDLEVLPDDFSGARETVYAPQAHGIIGDTLYAAVGIGIYYSDDDFAEDPFFNLRAGINLELLPRLFFDVSGNYRFTEWDNSITRDIDTDTVTIAAAVRLEL